MDVRAGFEKVKNENLKSVVKVLQSCNTSLGSQQVRQNGNIDVIYFTCELSKQVI